MATLARWQATITDEAGNIIPRAFVEVRRDTTGLPLVSMYSDRAGNVPMGNPVQADDEGFISFHVRGGPHRIRAYTGSSLAPTFERIWRYVPIGTAGELDQDALYGRGLIIQSTRAGLLAITPEEETDGGWVIDDVNPTYNGVYTREGAAWVRQRGFPDTFARLTATGGTPNAQTASLDVAVDPATVLMFFMTPTQTNTTTMTLNGLPVKSLIGDDLLPGQWFAGRSYLLTLEAGGTYWRLRNEGDVSGIPAGIAAAAAAAMIPINAAVVTATDAAGAAEESAEEASTDADAAETARLLAEAARDASFALGPKYATEALGRAAVADGVAFLVQGDAAAGIAAYEYRRVSAVTVSLLIATYPSVEGVVRAVSNPSEGVVKEPIGGSAIADEATGKELLGFDQDGRARLSEGLSLHKYSVADDGKIDLVRIDGPAGYIYRLIAIDARTGLLSLGAMDSDTVARLRTQLEISRAGGFGRVVQREKMTYLIGAGQSLGVGHGAEPAKLAGRPAFVSKYPVNPYALMFNTGLRGRMGGVLNPATLVDLVPAIEEYTSVAFGETPASGAMGQLYQLDRQTGETAVMLWRTHARGGSRVDQINKGTQSYANGIMELQAAVDLAALYDYEIEARAIFWTQGEQDRGDGTSKANYLARMIQLLADYNSDMLPILPVGAPSIIMIIDQLCAASAGTGSPIQIAQYELAKSQPGFYIACPKYMFQMTDGIHLLPESTAILGEYHAKAFHKICRLGGSSWKPVMPTSVIRTGNQVVVLFNRPVGGNLVFDTTTLPLATNYGFAYVGANISSVVISNAATGEVTITLDASVGGTLRYAYSGPGVGDLSRPGAWGNLRDEDPTPSITKPGYVLYNWSITFEETVA